MSRWTVKQDRADIRRSRRPALGSARYARLACLVFGALAACQANNASPAAGADATTLDSAPSDGDASDGDASVEGGTDVADASPPLRVLFVGNSYTHQNDLPGVVRSLGAATPGAAVEVEAITEGGAALWTHWSLTGARERIEMGDLDAVVLQGQSLETVTEPDGFDLSAQLLLASRSTTTPTTAATATGRAPSRILAARVFAAASRA